MSCPPDKSCVQLKLITVVEVKNDLGVKINRLQEVYYCILGGQRALTLTRLPLDGEEGGENENVRGIRCE